MEIWELLQSFFQAGAIKGVEMESRMEWSEKECEISDRLVKEAKSWSLLKNFDGTSGLVVVWGYQWEQYSENQKLLFARAMLCQCHIKCRFDVPSITIKDSLSGMPLVKYAREALLLSKMSDKRLN
ncbi:hypothetical protein KKC97_00085 [bacterium]|nr:hypothetical protein [bacterium]